MINDKPRSEVPGDSEIEQLARIVLSQYPQLGPSPSTSARFRDVDMSDFLAGFRRSVHVIAGLNRISPGDPFNDRTEIARLRADIAMHLKIEVGVGFFAAAIASGVWYSLDPAHAGLRFDGLGVEPSAGWREILATGRLPAPERAPSPYRDVMAPRSPTTVRLGQTPHVLSREFRES